MNLGLIGAESYHARAFGEIFNVFRFVRGVRVTHLWGETEALAREKADLGRIPHLVARPEDMIGHVDGALVLLRDGAKHLAAARPFLKAGLPVFVDKPVANSVADVRSLLRLRRQAGVPLVTGSSVVLQRSVAPMKRALREAGKILAAQLVGPGELENEWGGLPFYGSHLAELMVELFGPEVASVQASVHEQVITAVCRDADGLPVTLCFHPREVFYDLPRYWTLSFVGTKGPWQGELAYDEVPSLPEPNPYVAMAKLIVKTFRSGEGPYSEGRMLTPVAVLEAVGRSLATGQPVALP